MRLKSLITSLLVVSLTCLSFSPARAVNYTITYDANATMLYSGVTSGAVPDNQSVASGSSAIVSANTKNLARQGFELSGWSDNADGSGNTYALGTGSFVMPASNKTLYAKWTVPASGRLIANGGTVYSTNNNGGVSGNTPCTGGYIRGITGDSTFVYYRSSTDATKLCKVTMTTGQLSAVLSIGSPATNVTSDSRALAYSSGCIFLRDGGTTTAPLYCIDPNTGNAAAITVPPSYPFFIGKGWLDGNLISFPDGRIGVISSPGGDTNKLTYTTGTGAGQCPSGMYCKTLRTYRLTGTGTSVTMAWSEDFILADNDSVWPSDDHGIATDGTYLYQINYNDATTKGGYKVYALQSGAPSYLVFNGYNSSTGTCSATLALAVASYCTINTPTGNSADGTFLNGTYLGRNHSTGQYLIGDYSASKYWVSTAIFPPIGPGSAVTTAGSVTTSGTVYKGITTTITVTSNTPARVRFFVDGKRISTCMAVNTSGSYPNYTATCSWKPAYMSRHVLTATITPNDALFSSSTTVSNAIYIQRRTTRR